MCAKIERFSCGKLPNDEVFHLFGRFVEQQGSHRFAHFEVLIQHIGRRLEVERESLGVDVIDVIEETRRATAATDEHILELGHLVQHVSFDAAKALFALFSMYQSKS